MRHAACSAACMLARIVLSCVTLVVLSACAAPPASGSEDFPDAAYASFTADAAFVELRTAPAQPPERGEITAEVRVHDAQALPRDGLAIDVVAFMGAHGHGAAGTPTITPLGEGRYRIEHLALAMPGFWQLRLSFRGEGIDAHATTTLEVR